MEFAANDLLGRHSRLLAGRNKTYSYFSSSRWKSGTMSGKVRIGLWPILWRLGPFGSIYKIKLYYKQKYRDTPMKLHQLLGYLPEELLMKLMGEYRMAIER